MIRDVYGLKYNP